MKRLFMLLVAGLVAFLQPLLAQPDQQDERRGFERIEHFKKVRLIEILDLKEEQSVRFFARLNEHDAAKREIIQERMKALDKIDRLVRNNADSSEFTKVFAEVAAANAKLFQEDVKFFNSLADILTAEQRGKYLLFERRFERELREAMRDVQRRRMHMGDR